LTRKTLLTLGLLVAFVLAACTPTAPAPPPAPTTAVEPAAPAQDPAPEAEAEPPTAVPVAEEAPPAESEAPVEEPAVVVTPRGNDLEATDPNTVNLASGEPQLIEFFAFW
jgi:hypothetical protein